MFETHGNGQIPSLLEGYLVCSRLINISNNATGKFNVNNEKIAKKV